MYVNDHLNNTVEHSNFCRHVQQPGEIFDDFLIPLKELAKSCKYCSESYTEKNIQGQIIKGVSKSS